MVRPLPDAQAYRGLAAGRALQSRLVANPVLACGIRNVGYAVVTDQNDMPAGSNVLVQVTEQRQENLIYVHVALAVAVIFYPFDLVALFVGNGF